MAPTRYPELVCRCHVASLERANSICKHMLSLSFSTFLVLTPRLKLWQGTLKPELRPSMNPMNSSLVTGLLDISLCNGVSMLLDNFDLGIRRRQPYREHLMRPPGGWLVFTGDQQKM